MLALVAFAAEVIGDNAMADKYAEQCIKDFKNSNAMVRCSMLTLRDRLAGKRGDRTAAVHYLRMAAQEAIDERQPLMALCAGLDCQGSEGETIIETACKAIGRPCEAMLTEFQNARLPE